MTSKTFKSVIGTSDSRRVHIESRPEGPNLWISDNSWGSDYGITLDPSDGPALMQAIGECLPPIPEKVLDGSYEAYMSVALNYLGKAVRTLEAETAEAEAQAKLEAEAMVLFKASGAFVSYRSSLKFSDLDEHVQECWLAVARRARELNKEAGQ